MLLDLMSNKLKIQFPMRLTYLVIFMNININSNMIPIIKYFLRKKKWKKVYNVDLDHGVLSILGGC